MENESQRATVCRGFDDVWHGRATVEEAAARAGIAPSGRTASASVEQRHAAAAAIANRVLEGEQLRGVCHCAPRICHGRTILRHVMDLVHAAREPRMPTTRRKRAMPFNGTLMLIVLGLAVAAPTAAAPAAGSPGAVHPLFAPLAMGMPRTASLSRSPSPLAPGTTPPTREPPRERRWQRTAAAVAVATYVLSPPRKRRAIMEASPEASAHAPPARHSTPRSAFQEVEDDGEGVGIGMAPPKPRTATSTQKPFQPASPDTTSKGGSKGRMHARPSDVEDPDTQADAAATGGGGPPRARWSPQPQSAAAARATAAGDLAATLANDTSKYAIMQGRPEALADLCEEAAALRNEGAKKGTDKRDTWGYNKVKMICESAELNSPIMRPRTHDIDAAGRGREAFWAALLVMKLIMVIAPCARNAAKGVTQGKPASALQAVYGYYNVQRDCGRFVPDFRLAAQHLRGLNERFKRLFGLGALVKRQVQPFSLAMLMCMITLVTSGGGIPGWSTTLTACMAVLIPFVVMTGTRKDEFSKDGAKDNDYLRRSNFQWMDGDREIPHTPANLRALPPRAFLRGQAGPSKCDRYLQTWGARHQWFQRNDANPLNFASAWRRWELAYPCPIDERATWAAFSPTGTATPFSPSAADKALNTLMTAALGAAAAALRSWHAFRVTLASALRGIPRTAGETTEDNNGIIQMCLRWSSIESVRTYSRINRYEYARYTELGSSTCALKASNKEPLPPTDPADVATEIDDTIDAMTTPVRARTTPATASTPPPAKAPADLSPITPTNAVGRRVLIPAETWPDETCLEHDGAGWEATVERCSTRGATVSFSNARTARGRRYGDVQLKLSALQPL